MNLNGEKLTRAGVTILVGFITKDKRKALECGRAAATIYTSLNGPKTIDLPPRDPRRHDH